MPLIIDVYAREVIDSRGNPTVEVEVLTESGAFLDRSRKIVRRDGCILL